MIQDLRVVERFFREDEALSSGLATMSPPGCSWEDIAARFAIRMSVEGNLALWTAPLGTPDPEEVTPAGEPVSWDAWFHVRDLPTPAVHLWPCGCLPNQGDAHRRGCPLYPEGKRA